MSETEEAIRELHIPTLDYFGREVCSYCKSLCHSRSGIGCDYEGDALFPCATISILDNRGIGQANLANESELRENIAKEILPLLIELRLNEEIQEHCQDLISKLDAAIARGLE